MCQYANMLIGWRVYYLSFLSVSNCKHTTAYKHITALSLSFGTDNLVTEFNTDSGVFVPAYLV